MSENYFAELYSINVNDKVEKKNGLNYLSWAWAWAEVKKRFPDATYHIYEWLNQQGCPQNYFTDGRTAWVKTGVTINGIEHIEELPVMDYKNKSIPLENITSFDVNKAIQRSLTKSCARHGCGLYLYASEDLPESDAGSKGTYDPPPLSQEIRCAECGKPITEYDFGHGMVPAEEIAKQTARSKFKKCLCGECYTRLKANG